MFIPPGYLNFQVLFTMPNGRNALTAIGFDAVDLSPSDVADAGEAWGDSLWFGNIDSGITLDAVRAVIGTSDPSAPIVYEAVVGTPGGNGGEGESPQVSYLIRKSTNRGGRKGRGRCYHPGPPTEYVNDAGQLGAELSTLQGQWEVMIGNVIDALGSTNAYLLHTDAADGDPNIITAFQLDSMVATQRRRLRG